MIESGAASRLEIAACRRRDVRRQRRERAISRSLAFIAALVLLAPVGIWLSSCDEEWGLLHTCAPRFLTDGSRIEVWCRRDLPHGPRRYVLVAASGHRRRLRFESDLLSPAIDIADPGAALAWLWLVRRIDDRVQRERGGAILEDTASLHARSAIRLEERLPELAGEASRARLSELVGVHRAAERFLRGLPRGRRLPSGAWECFYLGIDFDREHGDRAFVGREVLARDGRSLACARTAPPAAVAAVIDDLAFMLHARRP